jgi:hypothetical protein
MGLLGENEVARRGEDGPPRSPSRYGSLTKAQLDALLAQGEKEGRFGPPMPDLPRSDAPDPPEAA